jgi:protein-arginine deiminase
MANAAGTTAVTPDAHKSPLIMRGGQMTFFDWQNGDAISGRNTRSQPERAGVANDLVRDTSVWDGFVTLTLAITPGDGSAAATDTVKLRVAPVVTRHHLAQEEQIFVTRFSTDPGSVALRATLYSNLAGNGEGEGMTLPAQPPQNVYEINGDKAYGNYFPYDDQWSQDFFEIGYIDAGRTGQRIDVHLRSANVTTPMRRTRCDAGKAVFALLPRQGRGGRQQYAINHDQNSDSRLVRQPRDDPAVNGGKGYPRKNLPQDHPLVRDRSPFRC